MNYHYSPAKAKAASVARPEGATVAIATVVSDELDVSATVITHTDTHH